MAKFSEHYLSSWPEPTERERLLVAIGAEYHNRCEAFDRSLARSRAEMHRIPIAQAASRLMPNELGASNRHARKVKAELMQRHGITSAEFREAAGLGCDRQSKTSG